MTATTEGLTFIDRLLSYVHYRPAAVADDRNDLASRRERDRAGMVAAEQAVARPVPTIARIAQGLDGTWAKLEWVLFRLDPALGGGADANGWDVRHLLSHMVGAWQRVPIHGAFFLGNRSATEVAIQIGDDYWMPEWETAPLASFVAAMRAAYEGNRAFLRTLDSAALARTAVTPFGEMTLGELLLLSYEGHVGAVHLPQLETHLRR